MQFDVIVIGCGPAGLAASFELSLNQGLKVALIDPDFDKHTVGEVLPPSVVGYLSRYGVLDSFLSDCSIKSDGITLWWGSDVGQDKDFIYHPHTFGYHVNRPKMESLLRFEAIRQGVQIVRARRYMCCKDIGDEYWSVTISSNVELIKKLKAPVLINATGRSGKLRQISGNRLNHDKLLGCYQYVHIGDQNWEPRLWIEAVSSGWFYSAPLPGNKGIVVFLTDRALCGKNLTKFIQSQMMEAVNTLYRVATSRVTQPMKLCNANSSVVDGTHRAGVITVGDASFSTDPLRGQGILQAFKQAQEAGLAIKLYLKGDKVALKDYMANVIERYYTYLSNKPKLYGIEQRWSNNLFWSSRISKPKLDY